MPQQTRTSHKLGPITIALWLSVVFVLAGCDRNDGPSTSGSDRVVVQYWEKWTGFEGEAMQAIVDRFNASQDRIEVKVLTVSQIDQKFLLAAAGGNPPDVVGLWSHSIPILAEKNTLLPLDARAAKAGLSRDDYMPVFWDLCTHRGFLWALPSTPATLALHWNKRMFREAGLDPDRPPRTIAELDAMSDALTVVELKRHGKTVRVHYNELTDAEKKAKAFELVQVGFLPSDCWYKAMYGYWFDGDLWDGDRTVTADAAGNRAAFEWYADYPRRYGRDNINRFAQSFGNFASAQNPFLTDQMAMVIQGVWMFNFIEKYNPDMEWGVAAFPAATERPDSPVSIAECDVLVIPREAPHPDEAFAFISFVQQQKQLEDLNVAQRKFSPLIEHSDDMIARHPNPNIKVFLDLARSSAVHVAPRTAVWYQYNDEMNVAAQRIFDGTMTVEEALRKAQDRVQWRLDRLARRWEVVKDARVEAWAAP